MKVINIKEAEEAVNKNTCLVSIKIMEQQNLCKVQRLSRKESTQANGIGSEDLYSKLRRKDALPV